MKTHVVRTLAPFALAACIVGGAFFRAPSTTRPSTPKPAAPAAISCVDHATLPLPASKSDVIACVTGVSPS